MKILIAEDEVSSRVTLERLLDSWGYQVVVTGNGREAWAALQADDAPRLAILDWVMPGQDGVEICRRVRKLKTRVPTYLILLTVRNEQKNIIEGLKAGADDYVTKPFDRSELRARIEVGCRILELQDNLAGRIQELQEALDHVKTLQGILPICMHCHKIRNDQEIWEKLERYISKHSEVEFTHGICPECYQQHYSELAAEERRKIERRDDTDGGT